MPEATPVHTREVDLGDGDHVSLQWAGLTDQGRRRETNQDSLLAAYPLFVVADGMGGHAGGEVASQRTVARLSDVAETGDVSSVNIESAIARAVDDLLSHPETTDDGTGTTLTGIYLDVAGRRWVSMNIGDSRVYLMRGRVLKQVTTDHSVVQELIASGRLSPEEAEGHPYSNVITRAVGVSELAPPDYREFEIVDGDRFVICSDGLTKELTDFGIQHFLHEHVDPGAAADAMLEAALENGGRDNVTVIIVDVARTSDSSPQVPAFD